MNNIPQMERHHKRRLRAERRFRWYGRAALAFALGWLVLLLGGLFSNGLSGVMKSEIRLIVPMDASLLALSPEETREGLTPARFNPLLRAALATQFPDANTREITKLLGSGAGRVLKRRAEADPSLWGTTQQFILPASRLVEVFLNNPSSAELSEDQRRVLQRLEADGALRHGIDWDFFARADSRSPENAGFLGAMMGSLFTLIVCFCVAFPLAVMSAVYLQEFAHKTRFAQLIEVNVNNLAAVPSIVYGLLGLELYINVMHLPRSAPLVGGLTLALMVFPVIIIATRSALSSVPPSIRQGALALGASPLQVVWHHTLPLAMPGIMTGTILGMARAIGETAPLLMIGMVAFVADVPHGFTQAATAMPVQIYLWASSPESGFAAKTASGILVLLLLLLAMNALAIYLRKKYEVRW